MTTVNFNEIPVTGKVYQTGNHFQTIDQTRVLRLTSAAGFVLADARRTLPVLCNLRDDHGRSLSTSYWFEFR